MVAVLKIKKKKKKKNIEEYWLDTLCLAHVLFAATNVSPFFFLVGQLDSHQFDQLCTDDVRSEQNALVASRQIHVSVLLKIHSRPSLSKRKFSEEFAHIQSRISREKTMKRIVE